MKFQIDRIKCPAVKTHTHLLVACVIACVRWFVVFLFGLLRGIVPTKIFSVRNSSASYLASSCHFSTRSYVQRWIVRRGIISARDCPARELSDEQLTGEEFFAKHCPDTIWEVPSINGNGILKIFYKSDQLRKIKKKNHHAWVGVFNIGLKEEVIVDVSELHNLPKIFELPIQNQYLYPFWAASRFFVPHTTQKKICWAKKNVFLYFMARPR